jgi:serine/threonine-protein kinase
MGTAIVGRYVLLGPIGYGGVSVVYQAIDTLRGERTAIKLLAPVFASDPRARLRVHQEALITERLRHPSVPKVYGFGDAWLPDGNSVPYVAMELLTGAVLAGRLAGGAMHWREAVRVAATIADVLAMAHRRGVVHRDLTPANIMMTTAGVKIIDFGEATTVEPLSAMARAAGPLPVRPASIANTPADDVYALGVVLYQMLTGHSPYPGGGPDGDLAAARLRHTAPTPVLLVPHLPRVLAELCRDCMAKRPGGRPDSARLAVALWALLDPGAMLEPAGWPVGLSAGPYGGLAVAEPPRGADAFSWWRRQTPATQSRSPAAQPPPAHPRAAIPRAATPRAATSRTARSKAAASGTAASGTVTLPSPARRPAPRHAAVRGSAALARSAPYSRGYG